MVSVVELVAPSQEPTSDRMILVFYPYHATYSGNIDSFRFSIFLSLRDLPLKLVCEILNLVFDVSLCIFAGVIDL